MENISGSGVRLGQTGRTKPASTKRLKIERKVTQCHSVMVVSGYYTGSPVLTAYRDIGSTCV